MGTGLGSIGSAQEWLIGNRAAEVKRIPSPFVHSGEAIWFRAPPDKYGGLVWQSTDVNVGQRYSLSFFFQNHVVENPAPRRRLSVNVYDGPKQIHTQILYRSNQAQFYTVDLEFLSNEVTVRLDLPAGEEVVVGEFGRAVRVDELASTHHPLMMELWMPTLQVPDVYRGLRNYMAEVELSNKRASKLFGLEAVNVLASMKISSAKLPRLLPGKNQLQVVRDAGAPGGRIEVAVTPRELAGPPQLIIEHDPVVPADGATFGRVFITTADDTTRVVPGAFYRLAGPPEVRTWPAMKAIADSQKLQMTREFHVTSLVPGEHSLVVERWDGSSWEVTDSRVVIQFEKVVHPAWAYQRSDYIRRWLEPQGMLREAVDSTRAEILLDGVAGASRIELPIHSQLAPRVDWSVTGPVTGLGLFSEFQPDPRTLRTTADSLHTLVTQGSEEPEFDFAVGVEAYVALLMEGILPERFCFLDYPSLGRLHREGRGWCMQYSSAVYALAIEGGLEARFRNLPRHVTTEVRGAELSAINLDAMVQAAVVDASGHRLSLDDAENEGSRILGVGVDGMSQRGAQADYLSDRVLPAKDWIRRDSEDSAYLNWVLDDQVFSIDLEPGEVLTWSSGSIAPTAFGSLRGLRSENQNVLTKTSKYTVEHLLTSPVVSLDRLDANEIGLLAPANDKVGRLRFPINLPVEASDLIIELEGSIDGGGQVKVTLYPALAESLIPGDDWVGLENPAP